MAKDYVTFVVDSEISLQDYSVVILEFKNLIEILSAEVSPLKELHWIIGGFSSSSAHVLIKGKYETSEEKALIVKTVEKWEEFGENLATGTISHYSPALKNAGKKILRLSDRHPIRFETEEKDSFINKNSIKKPKETPQEASYGAVKGRVECLTSRNELRFTLYDMLFDKAVSCYLYEEQKELMREAWGKLASVEGFIRREPGSGRPLTIRKIEKITILDENQPYTWKDLIGCIPSSNESADLGEIINRFRNG